MGNCVKFYHNYYMNHICGLSWLIIAQKGTGEYFTFAGHFESHLNSIAIALIIMETKKSVGVNEQK